MSRDKMTTSTLFPSSRESLPWRRCRGILERWISAAFSTPMSTKAPNDVVLVTRPVTVDPTLRSFILVMPCLNSGFSNSEIQATRGVKIKRSQPECLQRGACGGRMDTNATATLALREVPRKEILKLSTLIRFLISQPKIGVL